MRQLKNELIASLDDGGLDGARHAITNDVIIIETLLCSLAPPHFFDYLSLDIVEEALKNKALCH